MTSTGGAGTGDMFNAGAVLTAGLEMMIAQDIMSLFNINTISAPVTVAYTFTHSQFKNDFVANYADWGTVVAGDFFPYQAAHQLNVVATCQVKKIAVYISTNYMSYMRIEPGQGSVEDIEVIPARTVVDGNITYTATPNWRFYINCSNMLNTVYLVSDKPAGLRPGLPRTFSAGIRLDI